MEVEKSTNKGMNKQEKAGNQSDNTTIQQVVINLHTNMNILACMVLEKSLMKNVILQSMEGKQIGKIQGRISRRRLVLNPTIQQCIMNLHTLDQLSTLHGC